VTDHTGDELNVAALSDALPSTGEQKPLMKMSEDVTGLPVASPSDSGQILFDSDGSEDLAFSTVQPLADSSRNENIMLLDTDDEASFHQVPCLIPESILPSSSPLCKNVNDKTALASGIPADTTDANIPNGSVQEPSQNQMFDFVDDIIRSSSPNSSNQSPTLPYLRSRAAKKGDRQPKNLTG